MDPELRAELERKAAFLSSRFHDADANWSVYPDLTMRYAWFLMNDWIGAGYGNSNFETACMALIAVSNYCQTN